MRTITRAALAAACLAALGSLAGCVSFGAKPPPSLLTLTAANRPAVGQDQSSAAQQPIVVDTPAAPEMLATPRVPVQTSPTTVAYVAKAQWSAPPARLFAPLLAETVAARTGRVVLSSVEAVSAPAARLGGDLRFFGIDAGPHQAVVVFEAALTRVPNKGVVEKRRFEARVPVAAIDADSVGPALNDAANQIAVQVADWVGR